MQISKVVLGVMLMLPSIFALAGGSAGNKPVKIIHYYDGHLGVLVQQPDMIDPDSCGRKEWYILRDSHPHYKEIYSLILASHVSGQPLEFFLVGCVQGLPSIAHVYSHK